MQGPAAAYLDGGARLHLQHGPIDLIIGADAPARQAAFAAAVERFDSILPGLAVELPALRGPLQAEAPELQDPVARRMAAAALPHAAGFVTPMIAVAGAVADTVLAAMCRAVPLRRAYVNNGGDIALHLAGGEVFSVAMAEQAGADLGRIRVCAGDGIGGIATSGAGGRSFSLGIADSVTVLAQSAAAADAAATLIANAVDLPGHPGVQRRPACELSPDSDLGARLVVTHVPLLAPEDCRRAIAAGRAVAQSMLERGLIKGAALFLRGAQAALGQAVPQISNRKELHHA